MSENFPNLTKDISQQIQKAEQTPERINPKKSMPTNTIVKLNKTRDRKNLESSKK